MSPAIYRYLGLLFFLLIFHKMDAGMEDFFRKIEHKSTSHQMKNIDFIYMINLDVRPEKFASSSQELNPWGIYPYRFSAINGWELTLDVFNEVGLKFDSSMESGALGTVFRAYEGKIYSSHELIKEEGTTYFSHCLSPGAVGIVLSHLSILQDAYDSGYQTIWVMEDDIQAVRNPHEISLLIEKLDLLMSDWDVFFTDRDIRNSDGVAIPCLGSYPKPNFKIQPHEFFLDRFYLTEDFSQIRARYGAHSMIIRRSGIKKILDFIKTYKIYLPYDIDYCYPPGIKLIACNRDVVSNKPRAPSDNWFPRYLDK